MDERRFINNTERCGPVWGSIATQNETPTRAFGRVIIQEGLWLNASLRTPLRIANHIFFEHDGSKHNPVLRFNSAPETGLRLDENSLIFDINGSPALTLSSENVNIASPLQYITGDTTISSTTSKISMGGKILIDVLDILDANGTTLIPQPDLEVGESFNLAGTSESSAPTMLGAYNATTSEKVLSLRIEILCGCVDSGARFTIEAMAKLSPNVTITMIKTTTAKDIVTNQTNIEIRGNGKEISVWATGLDDNILTWQGKLSVKKLN